MSELFSILENPLIQLLLLAGTTVGLSWVSQREEQRRAALGLPQQPLMERVLHGLGLVAHQQATPSAQEDIWMVAARDLGLPIDKVLQLKERVQGGGVGHKPQVLKERTRRKKAIPARQAQSQPDGTAQRQTTPVKREGE